MTFKACGAANSTSLSNVGNSFEAFLQSETPNIQTQNSSHISPDQELDSKLKELDSDFLKIQSEIEDLRVANDSADSRMFHQSHLHAGQNFELSFEAQALRDLSAKLQKAAEH